MPNGALIAAQYRTAITTGGLCVRADRGLIQVTGADRATWLNNLVTNAVKTLRPGEGRYAFAPDTKGHIVADLNVLAFEDRLWLDLDRRWIEQAVAHLNRHLIVEDVALADISAHTCRIAVLGPRAGDVVRSLGLGDLAAMGQLRHVRGRLGDAEVRVLRNDFAGSPTAEFIILRDEGSAPPAERPMREISRVSGDLGLVALDQPVVDILRIEAGIPASIEDIDEDVLPPETGQIERGIDYHKGCYLGQEIIERMRSHGVLARRLVGLRIAGDMLVPPQSTIRVGQSLIGLTRSCCWSEALATVLALAYVKTAYAEAGVEILVGTAEGNREGMIVVLPFRPGAPGERRPIEPDK